LIKIFQILDWWWNRRRRRTPRNDPPRGVLLISSGGLGDTVLFAHVVERFAALAKDNEPVDVLLRSDAMKMAFLLPSSVSAIGVEFERLRRDMSYRREVMDNLFDAHYRLLVHTDYLRHPDLDEAMAAAVQAPDAAAMEPRPWRKYDTLLNRNRGLYGRLFDSGPPNLNKVLRWAKFADWLTGSETPPPVCLLDPAELAPAASVNGPVVVMQPFSAVKRKQSRPALFRRIIESLPAGTRVVITGASRDLEANGDYKPLLQMPGVEFDSSGFADLVPLLRAATLVISVDTALMHLAVAVGAPTLGLASAAYVGEIVPYDPAIAPGNARFVYHSMPCEGCLGACIHPAEDGMFPCVARLDEGQIISEVREMMSARAQAQ
jgi:ADP-heptose:LPS heptosyltransferase